MKGGAATRIICWNVNGLRTNLEEVTFLLMDAKPDILCLQERKHGLESLDPDIRGYTAHHGYMTANLGRSGVCMYTSRSLVIQSTKVRDTSNQVFRRVVSANQSLIIGCVYFPSRDLGTPHRLFALQSVMNLQQQFPLDPLMLYGDWNLKVQDLEMLLDTWRELVP